MALLTCQNCGSPNLELIFDLAAQPICGRFLNKNEFENERFYPLKLMRCPSCTLYQLEQVPPNNVVFGDRFGLFSGHSKETADYLQHLGDWLIERFHLKAGDYVVESGSNDGTFLKSLKSRGIQVLGVDPAKEVAKVANDSGIPTITKKFEECFEEIRQTVGDKLKMVVALRMLGLTDTIHPFLITTSQLLRKSSSGVFVSQSLYLPEMIRNYQWDTIYHEHARYYDATSLSDSLNRHGMNMFDAKYESYNSGTFLSFASVNNSTSSSETLNQMLLAEQKPLDPDSMFAFYCNTSADKFVNMVKGRKVTWPHVVPKGSRIAGIGAPMKSSTRLNFCNLGPETVEYLADTSPLKIGTYSPGMHIPVVSEDKFFEDPPDAAIVFAWQAKDRIMKEYRKRGYKGKFVIPTRFPELID